MLRRKEWIESRWQRRKVKSKGFHWAKEVSKWLHLIKKRRSNGTNIRRPCALNTCHCLQGARNASMSSIWWWIVSIIQWFDRLYAVLTATSSTQLHYLKHNYNRLMMVRNILQLDYHILMDYCGITVLVKCYLFVMIQYITQITVY